MECYQASYHGNSLILWGKGIYLFLEFPQMCQWRHVGWWHGPLRVASSVILSLLFLPWKMTLITEVSSPLTVFSPPPITSKDSLGHWHSSPRARQLARSVTAQGRCSSEWRGKFLSTTPRRKEDSRMSNRTYQGMPFLTFKSNKGLQILAFLIHLFSDNFWSGSSTWGGKGVVRYGLSMTCLAFELPA